MTAVTLGQFTKRLVASGLMSEEELQAFLDKLPKNRQPSDGKSFARMLVDAKILTSYQAGMVHQGKIKALVLGDYALLDRLGQGGMGMVFKARHKRMKRTVALKILPPSATKTPAMVKRFAREVEAAANLEHPNIVMAHDAGEARGVHFLVMQLISGEDLAVLVRRKGPLPVGAAVDCVLQVAKGLQYAHDRGIIHRDIKPNNLLVDETGTVKILDMGLARITVSPSPESEKEELTRTGATFGTVDFMAPEQAQDTKQADERSDIYSLGCTLFYLMTGRAMYPGGTAVQKIFAHAQGEIPSLSEFRPELSQELDVLFARMVAKGPEDRHQSMAEVIADLEKHCGGSQASAAAALAGSAEQGEGLDWLEAVSSDHEDNLQAWLKSESPEASTGATPHIDTTGLAETVDHQPLQDTHIRDAVGHQRTTGRGESRRRPSTAVIVASSVCGIAVLALLVVLLWPGTRATLEVASVDPPASPVSTNTREVAHVSKDLPPQKILRPAESTLAGNAPKANEQQADEPKAETATAPTPEMPEPTALTKEHELAEEGPLPPAMKPDASGVMPQQTSKEDPTSSPEKTGPAQDDKPQEPVVATAPEPPKPKVSLSEGDVELAKQELAKRLTADIRQAKETHAKATLAKKLLDGDTHDNSARQYAMLDQARELAIKAGDVTIALAAVGKMTKTFEVGKPLEFETLDDLNRYVRSSSDQREYLHAIVEFTRRAVQEDRFAEALQVLGRADSVARKCCGKGWRKRFAVACQELQAIAEERKGLEKQAVSLQENPEDRQSSLAVGQFWCFFVREWERGLLLLAQGSDERIAKLAEADLAMSKEAAASDLADLADRWWELAENTKVKTVMSACRSRAGYWYAKAEPSLGGVRKLEAARRIGEAAASDKDILSLLEACKAPPLAIAPFDAEQAKKHQETWADYLGVEVEVANSIGMKLVLIPPGEFRTGTYLARLTEPFYLGVYEVTQEEWQRVMGSNPSHFQLDVVGADTRRFPVESVSWSDAEEFCQRLSALRKRQKQEWTYRLPTDAEWEYACRSGTTTLFYYGDSLSLTEANYGGNDGKGGLQRTTVVGSYEPNAFGLFDMHGNVAEWLANWMNGRPYPEGRAQDPNYPSTGERRLCASGRWSSPPLYSRSAARDPLLPSQKPLNQGFRVAALLSSR